MFSGAVFGLPHLSEDAVAAFADGMLSPSAAARATRHCAQCAECADAVQVQREAASILRSAALPSVPSGLLQRLSGVPMSAPMPPPFGGLPTLIGSDGQPVFLSGGAPRRASDRTSGIAPTEFTAQEQSHDESNQPRSSSGRRPMRRVVIPIGIAASVAAVVAGTLAGQSQRLNGPVTGGSTNISGVVTGSGGSAPAAPASHLLGTSVINDQSGWLSVANNGAAVGTGRAAVREARLAPTGPRIPN